MILMIGRLYGIIAAMNSSFIYGAGTCPTVGLTGHILCGGYGYFGRKLGFASDQVVMMEVMLPSGKVIEASSVAQPDLFWALRGGCNTFAIITSITLRLTAYSENRFTIIELSSDFLSMPSSENMTHFYQLPYFWTKWATSSSPKCTSDLRFLAHGAHLVAIYFGSQKEALKFTFSDLRTLVAPFCVINGTTDDDCSRYLLRAYKESTFLEAVLHWSGDSYKTIDDLLRVSSLPKLPQRLGSHKKTKSLMVIMDSISLNSFERILKYRYSSPPLLNQVQIKVIMIIYYMFDSANTCTVKAYGGIGNQLDNSLYSDNQSPLLRGKGIEIHYGMSTSNATSSVETDNKLVNEVNDIAKTLRSDFGNNCSAYVGYIDLTLPNPAEIYFGKLNAKKLARVQVKYDPENVFESKTCKFLYHCGEVNHH